MYFKAKYMALMALKHRSLLEESRWQTLRVEQIKLWERILKVLKNSFKKIPGIVFPKLFFLKKLYCLLPNFSFQKIMYGLVWSETILFPSVE